VVGGVVRGGWGVVGCGHGVVTHLGDHFWCGHPSGH